jgi:hypothetical protein
MGDVVDVVGVEEAAVGVEGDTTNDGRALAGGVDGAVASAVNDTPPNDANTNAVNRVSYLELAINDWASLEGFLFVSKCTI